MQIYRNIAIYKTFTYKKYRSIAIFNIYIEYMDKQEINNGFIERLEQLMEYKSLNQSSLSKEIGFSYSTVNKYCNKKSNTIDFELIYRLVSHFSDIDTNWLIQGKGEMIIGSEQSNTSSGTTPIYDRETALIDTIAMQQETIHSLKEKIKTLEAELIIAKSQNKKIS
jgi:transcriptional regulator with XRE-family HTH domain